MMSVSERKVSFVIPAYNERESLPELYKSIMENVRGLLAKGLIGDYEFWFIDDGSTDGTGELLRELHAADGKVHYASFRRNFGKSIALETGFRNVTGDIIITMDADLQDDPRELESFLRKIDEGYDMVSGWKFIRQDPAEKRWPSKLFNRVTSKMSGIDLHDFDCDFKAYRREVVDAIHVYGSFHRYLPVMVRRQGFSIGEIKVHHNQRKYGKSKYGKERYLQGLFDYLSVSFLLRYADRPMYHFGRLGLRCCLYGILLCLLWIIVLLCTRSAFANALLILAVMLFVLGYQFFCTGYIGNMMVDTHIAEGYTEHRVREKR